MRRDILLLVVALVAVAGSAFAAWGTAEQRDRDLRGYANPAIDDALPYYVNKAGVNADLRDDADLSATLDEMAAAGIYWVRQVVVWDEAQAAANAFDYTKYDEIVNAFRERTDVALVALLDGDDTPPDAEAFTAFARAFALRYGDVVDVYQVWDEPNLMTSWSPEPRVETYAALLQAVYAAIHNADADATVLAAALAPTLETGPANISDVLYLDELYRLGLAEFSDGIAAKPYGFSDSPTAEPDATVLNFSRVLLLREVMLAHGDAATALWVSEFGWNSLPNGWAGDESIWGQVSAEQQTAYTLEALRLADEGYAWMGGVMLAQWQPSVSDSDARWGFALIDQTSAPTMLYEALAQRQSAIAGEGSAAPIGLHRPTNPYTIYSGVWTLSERGADIGWVGDSQLTFTFRGDAVSLLAREGDYTAYLYITIDDEPANALPQDADGNSYLLLTSDTLAPETRLTPLARGLGDGVHTLRMAADRGWDRWALAGFAVGGIDRTAPYNRQIALAIVSAAIAGLAAVVFGVCVAREVGRTDARTRRSAFLQRVVSEGARLALSAAASVILLLSVLLTWTEATPAFFRREPIQLGLAIVTAGLLYVNPALPIAIAAALVLFLLFYQRPLHGVALTIFYAPFFLFPVELFRFAFPMSELLVLVTFAAWLARNGVMWARGVKVSGISYQVSGISNYVAAEEGANSELRTQNTELNAPPFRFRLLDGLLAAWLVLGIVSLVWTEYRAPAVTELRTLFVEPCLFYIVLRLSKPRLADMLRLVDALVIAGVVVAMIGLFLFARGDAIITAEEGARRLASVYGSPNNVGLWLGRCLPFALAFALLPLDRWRRIFGAAAVIVFIPTMVLTQSAGALFVGVPVALVVTLVAALGKRAWLPLGGIAGAGAVALPLMLQSARFARLLDPTEGTNFFRLRVWQSAVAMIRDNPLTGLGQDQFLRVFRGRYILPDAWQEPNLSHPHNIVLDFWLRLGIAGVVLGIALHVVMARLLLRGLALARAEGAPISTALAVGALGCLANQIAHGLVDNSIFVNDLAYVFVLLAGLGMYLSDKSKD